MVIKPFSHLARQSFGKTFTHGYAQSVVAATQSSYASTTTPFLPLNHHNSNRLNRPGASQAHANFQHASSSSGLAGKAVQNADRNDGGLSAYYEAWQRHQQLHGGEGKEWKQFQFQKRLGWKQPTVEHPDVKNNESVDSASASTHLPSAPILERSYSASAVDEIKKVEDAVAEIGAGLNVDVPTANEYESITAADLSHSTALADRESSTTPSSSSRKSEENPSLSTSISEELSTASLDDGESQAFLQHINELHAAEQYAQIPVVFESMLVHGTKPTAEAYNALLAAALHSSKKQHQVVPKALDVYADMLRRKILPDTPFYTTMIQTLSNRALDVFYAKEALEQNQKRFSGLSGGKSFLFGSREAEYAILAEDDAINNAVSIFRSSLPHGGRAFSAETYRALITGCALHDAIDDMVHVYNQMEARGIKPMGSMFPPMIEAFARSGDLNSSVECYAEYKTLAMEDDAGKLSIVDRRDNEVYAAVVRAYAVCGKIEGGHRFAGRIVDSYDSVTENRKQRLESVQDTITLDALLQDRLVAQDFSSALRTAEERNLTPSARDQAMSRVCIAAADNSHLDVASKAYQYLPATGPHTATAAVAMLSLHVRLGNWETASDFWKALNAATLLDGSFVEPATFYASALIRAGRVDEGLVEAREAFHRIRNSASLPPVRNEVADQIDEAIHTIATLLAENGIRASPNASMNLLWSMVENGGLMSPSAEMVLAGFGPEEISSLSWQNRILALQVEAGLLGSGEEQFDIAHSARFSHLLDICLQEGTPFDKRTTKLIEKAVSKLSTEFPELATQWQNRHALRRASIVPQRSVTASPGSVTTSSAPYADTHDPYTATTDFKGSSIIIEELEARRHGNGLNEALMRFRNIRRAGRHPRFVAYAKLITAAAKEGRINLTYDIVGMARKDVPFIPGYAAILHGWISILDAMVGACLTSGRRAAAEDFHQELLNIGAAPTANTFGLYITTLKESVKTFDEATEAVTIFNRALAEGVTPSSFLYNALIGKLGKARRIDDCLRYFQEMRNAGIRPTSVTYGTIVNALCRVSDERFAEELFDEMESMPNYKPRPAPYNSLMQFFLTTKRDSRKVLTYYERMRACNIEPTMHTYKLLIDTHATLDPVDLAAAEKVLDDIRASGQRPEAVHYASLIHAKGCVLHDMEGAREVFEQALRNGEFAPQACLYQALFESMVANHSVSQTETVLDSMSANHVEMTPYIANTLIHGWATENRIAKAKAIFDSVGLEKREPSTYEAMTRAFLTVEDRDSALNVVHEMLSRGYPSAVSNKIIELVGHGLRPTGNTSVTSTATTSP